MLLGVRVGENYSIIRLLIGIIVLAAYAMVLIVVVRNEWGVGYHESITRLLEVRNQMAKVWIMRGVPGSGKDYWIKERFKDGTLKMETIVLSTDNYHINESGVYDYKQENAAAYHNKTLYTYANALARWGTKSRHDIVISNTNIRLFELAPYYRLAEAFGYEVEIVWVIADLALCKKRNQHKVPAATIEAMMRSIEPLPTWWNVRIVISGE